MSDARAIIADAIDSPHLMLAEHMRQGIADRIIAALTKAGLAIRPDITMIICERIDGNPIPEPAGEEIDLFEREIKPDQ